MTPDCKDFERLLALVLEDLAAEDEQARFQQMLLESAELRESYLRQIRAEALLSFSAGCAADASAAPRPANARRPIEIAPPLRKLPVQIEHWVNRPWVFSLFSAAVVLFCGVTLLGVWRSSRLDRPAVPNAARGNRPFDASAMLLNQFHCRWEGFDPGASPTARLEAGWRRLASGIAEIRCGQGAVLLVEGPAEFQLSTNNQCWLRSGSITARVPPRAIGFTLDTPVGRVVDLGTEFSALVDERGELIVQVHSGQIECQATTASQGGKSLPRRGRAGEALKITADGQIVSWTGQLAQASPLWPRRIRTPPWDATTRLRLLDATASFSQDFHGPFSVQHAVDGDPNTSWAIYREGETGAAATHGETAVFQLADLPPPPPDAIGWKLRFTLDSGAPSHPDTILGRFRLALTDADSTQFADGQATGGRLGDDAIWTVLEPTSWSIAASASVPDRYQSDLVARLTPLEDGSLLASQISAPRTRYTVEAQTRLMQPTGVRLEVLEHPTLPHAGPGISREHGNFTLSQFRVDVQPLREKR